MKRFLAPGAIAALALAIPACSPTVVKSTAPGENAQAVNIGSPLYNAEKPPVLSAPAMAAESIIVPLATVQFDEKITLSAEVDGKLELVARPLELGKKYDPNDPQFAGRLIPHPRQADWMHVRYVDGDSFSKGWILAFFDDSQTILDLTTLKASVEAAKDAFKETSSSASEYKVALAKLDELQGASSFIEKLSYRAKIAETRVTMARVNQELVRFEGDFEKAKDRKDRHLVAAGFDGRIVRILQNRGVFVKAGEPIIEVQNTGRFRVEAKLDWEVAEKLKPYTPVMVEPVRAYGPEPFSTRHRQDVTGIAVTAHKTRPLIVTASNDGTAIVWDVAGDKKTYALPHPPSSGVRSVAATYGKAEKQLVATGCTDGRVRVWDLTNADQIAQAPAFEFEESQGSAVSSVAFSPDGKYLAAASGRDVWLWDVEARKKKYAFPAEHRDDVKSLQFTPQATLVTVCRDKAIRTWTVGVDSAVVSRTLEHRSGAMDVLGTSADGGRVLFDQNPGRVDLVSLADGRTTGNLINPNGGIRFAGLALFSPDDKYVVTGAADADTKGELQLWAVPENGRGSERRRLVTPNRSAVTCAAFSSHPSQRFVAIGTQSGDVHFFALPAANEQAALPGKLVSKTRTDNRTATIRVEVENPNGIYNELLQDRGTATLIIDPNAKPVPPVLPNPGAPAPMGPGKAAIAPVRPGEIQLTSGTTPKERK